MDFIAILTIGTSCLLVLIFIAMIIIDFLMILEKRDRFVFHKDKQELIISTLDSIRPFREELDSLPAVKIALEKLQFLTELSVSEFTRFVPQKWEEMPNYPTDDTSTLLSKWFVDFYAQMEGASEGLKRRVKWLNDAIGDIYLENAPGKKCGLKPRDVVAQDYDYCLMALENGAFHGRISKS